MLVHSMNIDYVGHCFGAASNEYSAAAMKVDMILSNYMKLWLEDDYIIIVTSDHGMTQLKAHNGTTDLERLVPLYIAGINLTVNFSDNKFVSQLELAPLICNLLGIPTGEKMVKLNFLSSTDFFI